MLRTLAVVATTAVLACTGCSEDSSSASDPSTSESSSESSSESPSGSASETETPEPTESTSSAPEPTAAPADGPRISGSGYSYAVPKGWDMPKQDIPGFDFDSFAAALRDGDGFSDNMNVVVSPAGAMDPSQAEQAAEAELTTAGAKEVTVLDRVSIAGVESPHVTALMSLNDTRYQIEQFYPAQGDKGYVVTFSFSTSVDEGARAEVIDAVLASWEWSDGPAGA